MTLGRSSYITNYITDNFLRVTRPSKHPKPKINVGLGFSPELDLLLGPVVSFVGLDEQHWLGLKGLD